MLRIGLTGGMGAGKSTVAKRLVEHGAMVIDADAIARDVVEPGTDGLAQVISAFGAGVLAGDGSLDRQALAAVAFADEKSRERLNSIMHPLIGARTVELMARAADDAIVVHDIPLLVESDLAANYHLAVVVGAAADTRLRRLVTSRGLAADDVRARMAAQASDDQRHAAADVWLDNDGSPDLVLSEVDKLWSDRLVPFEANVRLRRLRPPAPARIVDYDRTWPEQARRLVARIRVAAGQRAVRIDHIGSTSVEGLAAKDVIDIQLSVATLTDADELRRPLELAGFIRNSGIGSDSPHPSDPDPQHWQKRLHTGADPARAVNLHVRVAGSPGQRFALLFRDWLRVDSTARDEYARAKRDLADRHAADATIDAYAIAKQAWIDAAFERAQAWAAEAGWKP